MHMQPTLGQILEKSSMNKHWNYLSINYKNVKILKETLNFIGLFLFEDFSEIFYININGRFLFVLPLCVTLLDRPDYLDYSMICQINTDGPFHCQHGRFSAFGNEISATLYEARPCHVFVNKIDQFNSTRGAVCIPQNILVKH